MAAKVGGALLALGGALFARKNSRSGGACVRVWVSFDWARKKSKIRFEQ